RQLLQEDRMVGVVESLAAITRVIADAEQPHLAETAEDRLVGPTHLVELAGARYELGLDELPHDGAELLGLGGAVDLVIRHERPCPRVPRRRAAPARRRLADRR